MSTWAPDFCLVGPKKGPFCALQVHDTRVRCFIMKPRKYHPFWSEHDKLYPGGSSRSNEWRSLKRQIRARDAGRCIACGSTTLLHVDHIIPLSKGGSNYSHNLQTLCKRCHEIKTGRPLMDWRERDNRGSENNRMSSDWAGPTYTPTKHADPQNSITLSEIAYLFGAGAIGSFFLGINFHSVAFLVIGIVLCLLWFVLKLIDGD